MKARNFTIDINQLDTQELEQLRCMFYNQNKMTECREINDRIAYMNGWLSEKKEKEHYERFCK